MLDVKNDGMIIPELDCNDTTESKEEGGQQLACAKAAEL